MSAFVYYNNGGGVTEDPGTAEDYYNYMRARWKDGKLITEGGNGRDGSEIPTKFMFSGDPVTCSYWTECNAGEGGAISPGDRRFAMTTGPFTINPGDQQEIVYGIVWALGENNLASVQALREADAFAQLAFDINFDLGELPDSPKVEVTELDGQAVLSWYNEPASNNYLESYTGYNPLADLYYEFEGYDVIQFASATDGVGKTVATFDKKNGITRVIDDNGSGITYVGAFGTDSGISTVYTLTGLTNFKEYYFGIQPYAYNANAVPKVLRGNVTKVTIMTSTSSLQISDDALALQASRDLISFDGTGNKGEGAVRVRVVNPSATKDATYAVTFYNHPTATEVYRQAAPASQESELDVFDPLFSNGATPALKSGADTCLTYDITRDGETVFNGSVTNKCAPLREDVIVIDGLSFSVTGPPERAVKSFNIISNAAGPIDPPACGSYQFNGSGFPETCGSDRPPATSQTNGTQWGIHAGGAGIPYGPASSSSSFLGRATRGVGIGDQIDVYDFELRFTSRGGLGWRAFQDGAVMEVPFELWNIGIATPDDPSDDVRLVPLINDVCEQMVFDACDDHAISGGANDPATDWIYWYNPDVDVDGVDDMVPGESGYEAFFFGSGDVGTEVWARMVLVALNLGTAPPYAAVHPEIGTTYRITTLKPSQPGDTFTLNTGDLDGDGTMRSIGAIRQSDLSEAEQLAAQKDALADIGVVPNPYKGASLYERSQLVDEVRFTNLPQDAVIRIFTLNGTLIRTLVKSGPARTMPWDLTTENLLPIASGLYLIHVEVPDVGERILKLAVVKKRAHLNVF
jgi:hypothetical protein